MCRTFGSEETDYFILVLDCEFFNKFETVHPFFSHKRMTTRRTDWISDKGSDLEGKNSTLKD